MSYSESLNAEDLLSTVPDLQEAWISKETHIFFFFFLSFSLYVSKQKFKMGRNKKIKQERKLRSLIWRDPFWILIAKEITVIENENTISLKCSMHK